jgi:hypothetical protein
VLPVRFRILNFLKLWVDMRHQDFDLKMLRRLGAFFSQVLLPLPLCLIAS